MESNKDEATKCYELSMKYYSEGNLEYAIKWCKKSLRLYPTDKAKDLLEKLNTVPRNEAEHEGPRKRSESTKETETPKVKREYSVEQETAVLMYLRKDKSDYYSLLEVEKSSTEVEIKKAYRKLALAFHPDKNNHDRADEAFKLVNKAFSILGDPEKRRMYDMHGITGERGRSPMSNMNGFHFSTFREEDIDPEELFRMFFQHAFNDETIQRRTSHRRRTRHQENASPQPSLLRLMSPLIIFIVFNIIFNMLASILNPTVQLENKYSFEETSQFPIHRKTYRRSIDYYTTKFNEDYIQQHDYRNIVREVRQYEDEIERTFAKYLQQNCHAEKKKNLSEQPFCEKFHEFYRELEFSFSRSSGAGGQHIADSKVTVRWNLNMAAKWLPDPIIDDIKMKYKSKLVKNEILQISCSDERCQHRNKDNVVKMLGEIVKTSGIPPSETSEEQKNRVQQLIRKAEQKRKELKIKMSNKKKERRNNKKDWDY
ncbi:DnaJ-domain-containing protein [Rozella allomycis CSF55]|uniref:DnaJ-domain-containing protein n=1 Tax=Rozella allomycis (strain CSF55) TaxID=988480 RepID=A0A4P9YPV0_ROZAC|nr:DnaJ-domain-containing protein [Rozella allomycis CSF55]